MDEAQYKEQCSQLNKEIRKVETAIPRFTKDVHNHTDDILTPLSVIEKKYNASEKLLEGFYDEIDKAANPE